MASTNRKQLRAVAYARFSSDMQREESVEAQIRAIEEYAKRQGYILISQYIDRAKSATTDKRPQFQKMISDSSKGTFDVVIVHKLDRFARNRYDSAHYKYQLKKNSVRLCSVVENLDGSPESIVLESVLEGMAEYYSKNLAREVEKGKKENALKGKHVGGIPPLGYDLDRETMTLIINESEAAAVRMIFSLYLKGHGYGDIIKKLNSEGYKTKRGQPFGKGSLYEILRNEKYRGVYVYNKSASKDVEGKFNRHKQKDTAEIIQIENAVPQIISTSDFQLAQAKMNERRHKAAKYTAKQDYLLSGKIICGECGAYYVGNSRKPRPDHPLYVSYRCSKKNGAVNCDNPEIKRETLEGEILCWLAETLFDEAIIPDLLSTYKEFINKQDFDAQKQKAHLESRLNEVDKGIKNIIKVMTGTGSSALLAQLTSLETEKEQLTCKYEGVLLQLQRKELDVHKLGESFKKAKRLLKNGKLQNKKEIIDQYIDKVIIYRDRIVIDVNVAEGFSINNAYRRDK